MKGVKAFIFDIGGVLYINKKALKDRKLLHRNIGVHQEIINNLKIEIDQYFDAIDSIYADAIEGKVSLNKVLSEFSKNLKVPKKRLEGIYYKAYKDHFQKNKELIKKASLLKKQGYKIAILSDQWPLSKKALVSKDLYGIFNPIIISCDVGMRKPNPKIYKLTLKKLKIKPQESVFIDNQKWNTDAAKKLGIKAIQFKNNKQTFGEIEKFLK